MYEICTSLNRVVWTRDKGGGGIEPCNTGLRRQYKRWNSDTNVTLDSNLVSECDNTDVPDFDFSTCDINTYMCCWTENDGQGMQDNTVRSCCFFRFLCTCQPQPHSDPSGFTHSCPQRGPFQASSSGCACRRF